jgi:hypothetical protein
MPFATPIGLISGSAGTKAAFAGLSAVTLRDIHIVITLIARKIAVSKYLD